MERRLIRERATLDQLRRDRVALADRLASEWATDPDRDDAGERIPDADRAIPRQDAR